MPKIVIATPAYGEMFFTPYVESLFKLVRAMDRRGWNSEFSAVNYADLADSRNILLTNWYDKTDATHLLFVDADMGFEPQLVFDMIEFDKPVLGAIYPKREIKLDQLAKLASNGEPAQRAIANAHDFVVRRPKRGAAHNGFIEVEGCGTGVFLIQRPCIDVMVKRIPEIIDTGPSRKLAERFDRLIRPFDFMTVDGLRLSEDYSFCYRWRHFCGGQVWANIVSDITHIGMHRFKARYSDAKGPRVRVVDLPITKIKRAIPNPPG